MTVGSPFACIFLAGYFIQPDWPTGLSEETCSDSLSVKIATIEEKDDNFKLDHFLTSHSFASRSPKYFEKMLAFSIYIPPKN